MINQYQQLVVDTANKYGVDPDLAMRVVNQESGFNPNARSSAGAGGLMQLMPGTAKDLGLSEQDRFNPEKNVDAGMRYLSQQIKDFGDVGLGLAAYNAGPGNVRKAGNQIPQFKETQDYVARIMGGREYRLPQKGTTVEPQQPTQIEPFDDKTYDRQLGRLEALRQQEVADINAAREGLAAQSLDREVPVPVGKVSAPIVVGSAPEVKLMTQEEMMGLANRKANGSSKLKFGV